MRSGSPVALARTLALAGLLAGACSSGGATGAKDGGAGGDGGAPAGAKFGAVLVVAPGVATGAASYFASAAFADLPHPLPGEDTSLKFGIGEPAGCANSTASGCRVFHCPTTIEAPSAQDVEPNVGAITITWPPASVPGDDVRTPPITFGPFTYDLFFWSTGSPVARFGFSAAGATIPAFPATDVDVPQPLAITTLNGVPVDVTPPPSIPRGAGLRLTWTGGTGDAVFHLQQRQFGSNSDLRAVCRVAASAGGFTLSSDLLGEFQAGDVSLDASTVSSTVVTAGDYATTLAIAVPFPWHVPFAIE